MRKNRKTRKHRCCKCGDKAVWMKMSGSKGRFMYCDEHVPRGCSCNIYNIECDGEPEKRSRVIWYSKEEYEKFLAKTTTVVPNQFGSIEKRNDSFYYEYVDDKYRREPCCEIEYDKDGFVIEETVYLLDEDDVVFAFNTHRLKYFISSLYAEEIKRLISSFFINGNHTVNYNDFMTVLGNISIKYFKPSYHGEINIKFYKSIKYKLREKRYKNGL